MCVTNVYLVDIIDKLSDIKAIKSHFDRELYPNLNMKCLTKADIDNHVISCSEDDYVIFDTDTDKNSNCFLKGHSKSVKKYVNRYNPDETKNVLFFCLANISCEICVDCAAIKKTNIPNSVGFSLKWNIPAFKQIQNHRFRGDAKSNTKIKYTTLLFLYLTKVKGRGYPIEFKKVMDKHDKLKDKFDHALKLLWHKLEEEKDAVGYFETKLCGMLFTPPPPPPPPIPQSFQA